MIPESELSGDQPADAVPDPRDRRQGERRGGGRRGADGTPGRERRRSDRRTPPVVPGQYRAGARHMNEYPLTPEEMEFINAVNAYKQRYERPFPTWSEVLHIVRALGYVKTGPTDPSGESAGS